MNFIHIWVQTTTDSYERSIFDFSWGRIFWWVSATSIESFSITHNKQARVKGKQISSSGKHEFTLKFNYRFSGPFLVFGIVLTYFIGKRSGECSKHFPESYRVRQPWISSVDFMSKFYGSDRFLSALMRWILNIRICNSFCLTRIHAKLINGGFIGVGQRKKLISFEIMESIIYILHTLLRQRRWKWRKTTALHPRCTSGLASFSSILDMSSSSR